MTKRIGLSTMRVQPLHRGHCRILHKMSMACEVSILCLGSAQKSREEHDPWTVDERIAMVKNVFGDRLKIVPVTDLGATTPQQWVDYLIGKITKLGLPEPTDYFTGSIMDGLWYRDYFAADWPAIEEFLKRKDLTTDKGYADAQHFAGRYLTHDHRVRRLHIVDRNGNPVPPATEIRGYLKLRNDGWKEWIPEVNHNLIEGTYPEEFKVPGIDA